jgi:hypothetical protein
VISIGFLALLVLDVLTQCPNDFPNERSLVVFRQRAHGIEYLYRKEKRDFSLSWFMFHAGIIPALLQHVKGEILPQTGMFG